MALLAAPPAVALAAAPPVVAAPPAAPPAVALLAAPPAVAFWEGARALAWQPVGLRVVSGEFCQWSCCQKRESCFDIVSKHDTRLVSTIAYTISATGTTVVNEFWKLGFH